MTSRREFIKTTAAAVTAAALVPSIGCSDSPLLLMQKVCLQEFLERQE